MCVRAEIALTDGRLMGVTRELNSTAEEDGALRRTLTDLERDLKDINTTVADKRRQLDDYLTSGFAGSKFIRAVRLKISSQEPPLHSCLTLYLYLYHIRCFLLLDVINNMTSAGELHFILF